MLLEFQLLSFLVTGNSQLVGESFRSGADDYAYAHAQSLYTLVRKKNAEIVQQYGTKITSAYKLELVRLTEPLLLSPG